MAQALPLCPHSAGLCRVRVTALNDDGTVADGPNNSYVTDSPIHLAAAPEIKAGTATDVTNGCGCVCVSRRTNDRLLRFNLTLQLCAVEPALLSMLLGASVIEDDSDIPVPKGIWWPNQADCGDAPASVAVEAWSEAWDSDAQSASPNRWIYWLFPRAFFQIGAIDLADGFMLPEVNGFTRANDQWGMGPYGDQADSAEPLGGLFWSDSIPDADCAFATITSS